MTLQELRKLIMTIRTNKRVAQHPNITRDGELMFWSVGKQEYIKSALQPKARTK